MRLSAADPNLRRWAKSRVLSVLDDFRVAIQHARRLDRWALRLLAVIYLSNKRRRLRRFLHRERLRIESPAASQATDPAAGRASPGQG